jgi:hypothetical protein
MAKLITGIFKSRSSAMLAVEDLMRHGIPQEDISIQMTDTSNGREFFTEASSKAPEYGVSGSIIGAVVGGLYGALCALGYLPDYSGLAALGTLYAVLAGIGAGSMLGLLVGFILGLSVPEFETDFHQVDRRAGAGILVGTYCHERRENEVRRLMEAAGGHQLRAKSLRTEPLRVHTTREYAGIGSAPSTDADKLPPDRPAA